MLAGHATGACPRCPLVLHIRDHTAQVQTCTHLPAPTHPAAGDLHGICAFLRLDTLEDRALFTRCMERPIKAREPGGLKRLQVSSSTGSVVVGWAYAARSFVGTGGRVGREVRSSKRCWLWVALGGQGRADAPDAPGCVPLPGADGRDCHAAHEGHAGGRAGGWLHGCSRAGASRSPSTTPGLLAPALAPDQPPAPPPTNRQVNGRPIVSLPPKTVHHVRVQLDEATRAKYERWQSAGRRGQAHGAAAAAPGVQGLLQPAGGPRWGACI